jgi:peptidoglycan/xylan/chitin deacetylase (PgdA/CDA1 family)
MEFIAKQRLAVSLDQFIGYLNGGVSLPDGSVLITSDDGFKSVHDVMLPVLESFDLPGVAFVSPGFVGASPENASERYMTWDELRKFEAKRISVQSHGWKHRSLGLLDEEEVRDEAVRSKECIERELGTSVTAIAYPYGTRADFNDVSERILAEVGYEAAFTSQHGYVLKSTPAIRVPGVKVEGGDSLWMFKQTCRGGMDGWRAVDHLLFRLQTANR